MSSLIPEILIVFATDAKEWDRYLTDCFAQMIEFPLTIFHKRIEDIHFPLSKSKSQKLSKSDAILIILSPEFLDLIYILSEKVFQLSKLFNPNKTLVMFCGIRENEISKTHKSVLINYNKWKHIISRDCDKRFAINVTKSLLNVLKMNLFISNNLNLSDKNLFNSLPKFELSTEKVFEVNNQK
jgi:hypothetical protein